MSDKTILSGWEINLPTINDFNELITQIAANECVLENKWLNDEDLVAELELSGNPSVVTYHNKPYALDCFLKKLIDKSLKKAKLDKMQLQGRRVRFYLTGHGMRTDLNNYQGFYDKNDVEDINYSPSIKKLHARHYAQDHLANELLRYYGLTWPPISIYSTSNSALMATHIGSKSINNGELDIVVVISWLDIYLQDILFIDGQDMLVQEHAQPFSPVSDGAILSEGYAVLILESESHINKRKFYPRVYINYSGCMQIHGERNSNVSFYTISKVIENTMKTLKLNASELGAVFAHGNGSIISDKAEAMAIENLLKDNLDIPVLSYKGQIGYISNCSGIIDLMIMTESILNKRILPSISHYSIMSNLKFNFFSDTEPLPYFKKCMLKLGLGMDGSIITMVLSSYQELN
ncbi:MULTISPECIES: beta-ketoacyl synthase N-terminal-like domain-containing protein [Providencia]|uniref:beta-ketoacyl synthase N-terminal-like domain-containing protein n=1 Tax=Providencia TaxID=586 RepID=UPI000D6F97CF|nr:MULTISPECIES: beta-ketoacyl synthase N-terminal-like domain-containing protein [Providencia]MCG5291464.1 3-ketoacyl-ACP synthase [Providencia rettgeri]MCX9096203.1 3-ketoacyl-ACP synthase [Providencia rettgeri]MDM9284925.1 beta-ketoacyl synthase N-terminal-like domain-containing protein [Providencia rettgeri]WOB80896.1 beta-ketoacyl synthase N-terminal-like domain-containing protein [Providencia sp. PROV114]HEE8951927.1 3-ketoacyl-ACP synthase [Providencia rettgeri]